MATPASKMTVETKSDPVTTLASAGGGDGGGNDMLARLDLRNKLMKQLKELGLKATWSELWTDMDGKPWPTAAAAEVIARECAVTLVDTSYKKETSTDNEGDFYFYVFKGTFSLPGGLDTFEVIGTCSSRDQFLGTETSRGREMSEINEDDINKAAYSNLIVNGVMRLLGLRGLTWEMLSRHGIDQSKASKIEHQKGGRGGGGKKSIPHAEREIPFGNETKGKKLQEITDSQLQYLKGAFERNVADKDKERWKDDNEAWVAAIVAEYARRANGKPSTGGSSPAAANAAGAPAPWQRIRAAPKANGFSDDELKAFVKKETGKASSNQLTDADVAKVLTALDEDIPF